MAIQSETGSTQMISIIGYPMCDIVYYFARALNAAGKRVLVVDNEKKHELFHSIRKPENEKLAQTGNIFYISNTAYSEEFFAQYDFVLIFHGMRINDELNVLSDFRYVVTDYRQSTTEELKKVLGRQEDTLKYYVIFRNKVFGKISEKLIMSEIGLIDKSIYEKYEITFNEMDYMCYMGLLRNGSVKTKATSPDIKDLVKSFLHVTIPDKLPKEYTQYFKGFVSGKIK